MGDKYAEYLKYLIKSNKKALVVFFVLFIAMMACFSVLAVFSPEDRRFAFGMVLFALTAYGFIHAAGFYYYIKNKPKDDGENKG